MVHSFSLPQPCPAGHTGKAQQVRGDEVECRLKLPSAGGAYQA